VNEENPGRDNQMNRAKKSSFLEDTIGLDPQGQMPANLLYHLLSSSFLVFSTPGNP
jgi:hypothetical protein